MVGVGLELDDAILEVALKILKLSAEALAECFQDGSGGWDNQVFGGQRPMHILEAILNGFWTQGYPVESLAEVFEILSLYRLLQH